MDFLITATVTFVGCFVLVPIGLAIIRKLGFAWCGQQVDPVDGTEDIFELDARVYRARLGA